MIEWHIDIPIPYAWLITKKPGVSDGVDFDFWLASIDLNECFLHSSSGGKHGLERRWICQPK